MPSNVPPGAAPDPQKRLATIKDRLHLLDSTPAQGEEAIRELYIEDVDALFTHIVAITADLTAVRAQLADVKALRQRVDKAEDAQKVAEAALTALRAELKQKEGEAYWRGFQQATWNKPGCLTTADELVAVSKELAEARARLALPAWQPIETAPANPSRWVQVCWADHPQSHPVSAIWRGDRRDGPAWCNEMGDPVGRYAHIGPTHWRELPPLPPTSPQGSLPAFITREGRDGTAPAPDESD